MVSADAPFLRACRCEPHDRVPVWFMRQAGRSLPEYRAIRGSGSIVQAIRTPDLATEITLQPVRRYGTDAAIQGKVQPGELVIIDGQLRVVPGAKVSFDDMRQLPEMIRKFAPAPLAAR